MKWFAVLVFLMAGFLSRAVEVRFPEEELESESILPIFEHNANVTMNRRVQMKYKLNLSGSAAHRLDEPFYARFGVFGSLGFGISEVHGVRIFGGYFQPGLSSLGEQFQLVSDLKTKQQKKFNVSFAPHPRYAFFVDYALTFFYGKISFSKSVVAHLNTSFAAGLGGLALVQQFSRNSDYSEAQWVPAVHLALNQKVFLTKQFYLQGGLDFIGYYGPNPVNNDIVNNSRAIRYDQFDSTYIFRILGRGGLGILVF